MRFDRKKLFDGYRLKFGGLDQQQVDGLNRLVSGIEQDPHVRDIRWAAYMLATAYHETAHTMQPIHEYGTRQYFINRYGGQTRKGKELGNDTPEEGYHYAGKGDVQLTGEANYEKAEAALRREYPNVIAVWEERTGKTFDLTVGDQPNDAADPQNAMDPEISYAIMSYGMRSGMFTGKKLSDYIDDVECDYKAARKIINGTDKNILIAGYAKNFEEVLRAAKTSAANAHNLPSDKPDTDPAASDPGRSETATLAADPIVETKTTEVVKTGDTTLAVEKTEPKGDAPDVEPTKVTKNGPLANWLFSGGTLTALGTAAWAYITGNASTVAVAVICVTVLIALIIFRGAITDAIRMQVAADPEKKNVT